MPLCIGVENSNGSEGKCAFLYNLFTTTYMSLQSKQDTERLMFFNQKIKM